MKGQEEKHSFDWRGALKVLSLKNKDGNILYSLLLLFIIMLYVIVNKSHEKTETNNPIAKHVPSSLPCLWH